MLPAKEMLLGVDEGWGTLTGFNQAESSMHEGRAGVWMFHVSKCLEEACLYLSFSLHDELCTQMCCRVTQAREQTDGTEGGHSGLVARKVG